MIEVTANGLCRRFSSFSYAIASLPGDPTIAEKAQKFIDSLGLGNRPEAAVVQTLSLALLPNNISTSRQRRANGLPVTCPASQQQKEICTDITGKHKVILFRQKMWQTSEQSTILTCNIQRPKMKCVLIAIDLAILAVFLRQIYNNTVLLHQLCLHPYPQIQQNIAPEVDAALNIQRTWSYWQTSSNNRNTCTPTRYRSAG